MKNSNGAVTLICRFIYIAILGFFCAQFDAPAAKADAQTLDALFEELQREDVEDWQLIEQKIWTEWSKSGSKGMDYLLERGRAEMEKGNFKDAIWHFSALIDHAPEFAEGWNARATAFFQADKYGLSMVDIRQTLLLEPRHFGALSGLGIILERIDRPEDALKAYHEVLKIHPYRPDALEAVERLEIVLEGTKL